MSALETRIPPPVVAILFFLAMWLLAVLAPGPVTLPAWREPVGAVIATLGGLVAVAALAAFGRAHTTLNPFAPEKCRAVVTSGVYRLTRNPMYVGLVLALLGWAIHLGVPVVFVGPPLFAAYIHRFQILPEERALATKFGEMYVSYMGRVPRWL